MKKWVENKEPSGAVVHTLVFGHHGDDPKVIVELFRDSEEIGLQYRMCSIQTGTC